MFSFCTGMRAAGVPADWTSVPEGLFYGCSGLEEIWITKPYGAAKPEPLDIPVTVKSIGKNAFRDCNRFTGSLVIPVGVTEIGEDAFCNCTGLKGKLVIPSSVTSIGDEAFYDTGFSKVENNSNVPLDDRVF